jgi:hypothetical protein
MILIPPGATCRWSADSERGWAAAASAVASRRAHTVLMQVRSHVVHRMARLHYHVRSLAPALSLRHDRFLTCAWDGVRPHRCALPWRSSRI